MASIKEKRGKKGTTYEITVSLGRDQYDKKIIKTTTYKPTTPESSPIKRKKEIEDFARDFERRVLNGDIKDGEKITFSDFVETVWKRDYAELKLSEHCKEAYYRQLDKVIIPEIGYLKLSSIRAVHINKLLRNLEDRGLKSGTVKRYLAVISAVFHLAYKLDYVKENPCSRCEVASNEHEYEHKCFDIEQTAKFLEALTLEYHYTQKAHYITDCHGEKKLIPEHQEPFSISYQLQVFLNLATFSGCRRGELIALNWNDIDFEENTISITKSASKTKAHGQIVKAPKTKAGNRIISIPESCIVQLKKLKFLQREKSMMLGADIWRGYFGADFDNNNVFIQDNGLMMNLDTPTHAITDVINYYNREYAKTETDKLPNIRLHDLRHTNATILLSQNQDIESVAKRLGHHKTSVTLDIYGHALKSKDAIASQTLENVLLRKQG